MQFSLPPEIWSALVNLLAAVAGWLTRGHFDRNGKKKKDGDGNN